MGKQIKLVASIIGLKTLLLILNLLFWFSGFGLIAIGLYSQLILLSAIPTALQEVSSAAAIVIIGIAVLILVITSIAFTCIIKGQSVQLYIYGGFTACVCMLYVGLAAAAYCYRDVLHREATQAIKQLMSNYNPKSADVDYIQSTWKCCGWSGYNDWIKDTQFRLVPMSCCINFDDCVTVNYNDLHQRVYTGSVGTSTAACQCSAGANTDFNRLHGVSLESAVVGCIEAIEESIRTNYAVLIGAALSTAVLPVVGTVLSCSLAYCVRKYKYNAMTDMAELPAT